MKASLRPIRLPGCKSLSARALVLAAVAEGESELRGLSDCADSVGLAAALEALGAGFDRTEAGVVRVQGMGGPPRAEGLRIDAGEAATNFRFLACLLAAGRTDVLLTGSAQLLSRPHQPLYDFLRSRGAAVEPASEGVRIRSRGLLGGAWDAPATASSQFLSGLALASAWSGEVTLGLPADLPSRGYFELTLATIRAFRGAPAAVREPAALRLRPGNPRGRAWTVPADASGATFFLVAAATGARPAVFETPWAEQHPEAALNRRWLEDSGLLAPVPGDRFDPAGEPPGCPLELDLDPAPDAGPALAVLAASLPAGIRFRGLERLRIKESDRLAGMKALAEALGARVEEEPEALMLRAGPSGPPPSPAPFDPRNDHRLAMAAAVAGLEVADPACVSKSFPGFWTEWNAWSRP